MLFLQEGVWKVIHAPGEVVHSFPVPAYTYFCRSQAPFLTDANYMIVYILRRSSSTYSTLSTSTSNV